MPMVSVKVYAHVQTSKAVERTRVIVCSGTRLAYVIWDNISCYQF